MKRKKIGKICLCFFVAIYIAGCGAEKPRLMWKEIEKSSDGVEVSEEKEQKKERVSNVMETVNKQVTPQEPAGRKRVFYAVKTDCFYDGDGDGNGDFAGIIKKISYMNDEKGEQALGVEGLALLPVMPQVQDGVTDFKAVDAKYGSLRDFEILARNCKEKNMALVLELPMNDTALTHTWFKQACEYLRERKNEKISKKECPYLNYYFFTQEPEESGFYPVNDTKWYYRAAKGTMLPELNMEEKTLQKSYEDIVEFWLNEGVDGFWLNEKSFYQKKRPDYSQSVMKWFANMVKEKKEEAYLLAETAQESEEQVYYNMGYDGVLNMELSGRTGSIAQILNEKTKNSGEKYGNLVMNIQKKMKEQRKYLNINMFSIPQKGRGADFFYGKNIEERIKIASAMNLMMSGSAVVMYGEELGMKDGGKLKNFYAPMLWKEDRTEDGMCWEQKTDAVQRFESEENQSKDKTSILSFYRQVLWLRKSYPQIANGETTFLEKVSNEQICFLQKEYQSKRILLAFNLSDRTAEIELDGLHTYGYDPTRLETGGILLTGTESAQLGENLVLPPYSMIILVSAMW